MLVDGLIWLVSLNVTAPYEAIGIKSYPTCFSKIRSMIVADGPFLNHGITRRGKRPEQHALLKYIFPGG